MQEAGVTGIVVRLEGKRTSDIGTGGTTLTAALFNTDFALSASVTARRGPTGGATSDGAILFPTVLGTDEVTNVSVGQTGSDLVMPVGLHVAPITLHATEGFKLTQVGSTGVAGDMAVLITFGVIEAN